MSCNLTSEKINELANKLNVTPEEVQSIAALWGTLDDNKKVEIAASPSKSLGRILTDYKVTLNDKLINIVDFKDDQLVYKDTDGTKTVDPKFVKAPNGTFLSTDSLNVLKSDVEFIIGDLDGFESYAADMINDPDKMRDLAREIDAADSIDIGDNYRTQLFNSLDMIIDPIKKLLPPINVHINKAFTTTGGAIKLDGEVKDLYLGIGPVGGNRSALEVYVHELYHAATDYLINNKDPYTAELKGRMEHIMTMFIKDTKPEDLAKFMENPTTAVKDSENMLKYISEHGLVEFIPHAMSNKAVMARLQEMSTSKVESEKSGGLTYDIIMWIRKAFQKVMERITKEPKGDDLTKMVFLVERLTRSNIKHLYNQRTNKIRKIFNLYDKADEYLANKIKEAKKFAENNPTPMPNTNMTPWQQYAQSGKIFARALFDSSSRANASVLLNAYGAKVEGTVQHIIRDLTKTNEFAAKIDNFGLQSQNIDRQREAVRHSVTHDIKDAFGRDLTELELASIKSTLLDTDSIILEDNIEEYLNPETGEDKVSQDIKDILDNLENTYGVSIKNYYQGQSMTLAKYMQTGKGDITLLKNAYNIAHRANDALTKTDTIDPETIQMIDKLVSLMALQSTSKTYKNNVYRLMQQGDNITNGIGTIMMNLKAAKEEATDLFGNEGEQYLYNKGYYKEVYPRNSENLVAPTADKAKLEADGYKLVQVLKPHELHGRTKEMGFYVSEMNLRPRMERGALRITNKTHKGFSIIESYNVELDDFLDPHNRSLAKSAAERDIAKFRTEMAKVIAAKKEGNFEIENEDNLHVHPMINGKGEITNFNYEMSKDKKVSLLGASTNPIDLIAATRASIIDKKLTAPLNEQIINLIQTNEKANKPNYANVGADLQLYAFIGPDVANKEHREMWRLLPKEVRYKLEKDNPKVQNPITGEWERIKPLGIKIRRDSINQIMGQKELQWMRTSFGKSLPKEVRVALMVAGKIWESIIGNLKSFIILKMPMVLINNVISNFMISGLTRTNFLNVAKLQLEGVKELNRYVDLSHKLFSLETKAKAGKATPEELRLIDTYKNRIENSSVAPLIKAGFYTQILEETEVDTESGDLISDAYHKQVAKLPKMLKNGLSLVLLDKNTPYFKFMYQATQYSDFTARYAQHYLNLKKGMEEQKSLNMVKDAFINYNRLDSPLISKLNKMGVVMFTKYYTRIHRYIAASIAENPLKVLAGLMALNLLAPDAANPWESGIFTKGLGNLVHGPIGELTTFNIPIIEAASEVL